MRTVVFVAPYLLEATARFVRATTGLPETRVAIVTHESAEQMPADLRRVLAGHWRVDNALDPAQLGPAVAALRDRLGGVDRIFGALEQLQVPLAEVREALGIPGMDPATARNFRDKARMKDVLRAAGIPCARHGLARSADEAEQVVYDIGFPVVVKPPAGAGARGTFRLEEPDALRSWLAGDPPSAERPALIEEFLVGEEHSFDSVAVDGEVVWASVSDYLPTPLAVLENPWMQWVVRLPRDVTGPEYRVIFDIGPAALRALGLRTGLTHLEWFRRPDGTVAVSEVAARPPGAQITSMLSYAHEFDLYEAWARLMAHDAFDPPERRWAVGTAYLRGQHPAGTPGPDSQVVGIDGVEQVAAELGDLVVEARLPERGRAAASTYEGEGYVIVRHTETEAVTNALRRLVTALTIRLG